MKKANLKIVLLLLPLLCLLQCTTPQPQEEFSQPEVSIDLQDIIERGYITALVDNNSISYFIYKGQPMGYQYELLKLLADHLKVGLRIKVVSGIEGAISQLNKGEGDILAFPLTITKARKRYVAFTKPHFFSYQVLVQRKPENWHRLTQDQINAQLLRNAADLVDREVHVLKNSSFVTRLEHLSEEMGGDILIREDSVEAQSESLIQKVALGEIEYTVADHAIATVNAAYYPNIDVNTILSLPQQLGWAVRLNSPELLDAVNEWLAKVKKEATFMVIYNRYYKSPRTSLLRMKSDYSSLGGNKLSPFDDWIKEGAEELGWDWRLLAAVVYQESRFILNGESWAGARGLMQLMPETAQRFGASNPDDPRQNIRAGVKFLKFLDRTWEQTISDPDERLKFVLASYNVGLTHITDARKLAEKYGKSPVLWEGHVEYYLLKKSDPKYYQDPLVVAGYCKCQEPVNYVRDILDRFQEYKIHINPELPESAGM